MKQMIIFIGAVAGVAFLLDEALRDVGIGATRSSTTSILRRRSIPRRRVCSKVDLGF
jgi:hypothetical protein